MAEYREGDLVKVKTLGKSGIVSTVLGGGRYKVSLGGLSVVCRESELIGSTKAPPSRKVEPSITIDVHSQRQRASSLDLHGMTVTEALREVEVYLDRAALGGNDKVTIVHGLGSGKLQRAVHQYLRTIAAVKSFKVNEGNPGETTVFF